MLIGIFKGLAPKFYATLYKVVLLKMLFGPLIIFFVLSLTMLSSRNYIPIIIYVIFAFTAAEALIELVLIRNKLVSLSIASPSCSNKVAPDNTLMDKVDDEGSNNINRIGLYDTTAISPLPPATKSKLGKALEEIKGGVNGNILNIILTFGLGIVLLYFNFDGTTTSGIVISISWKLTIGICLLAHPMPTILSK